MPAIGAIYKLAEADYRFGVGPLLVKITKIVSETVFDDEPWWDVEGLVKHPDYSGPGQERRLYLRAASLRNSRRPA
ncbi:MAG: hypothetical protein QOH97_3412 [Actinoplanes sp.]|nr:hypothetical protein [Actinoplanes sp.]